jgi:hypothetical protein
MDDTENKKEEIKLEKKDFDVFPWFIQFWLVMVAK